MKRRRDDIEKDPRITTPFTAGQPVYVFANTFERREGEGEAPWPALHRWHFVQLVRPGVGRIRNLAKGEESDVPMQELCGSVLEAMMTYVMQRMMIVARGEADASLSARHIIFAVEIGLGHMKTAGAMPDQDAADKIKELVAEIQRLRLELDEARKALAEYGDHARDCTMRRTEVYDAKQMMECSCGCRAESERFRAIVDAAAALKPLVYKHGIPDRLYEAYMVLERATNAIAPPAVSETKSPTGVKL